MWVSRFEPAEPDQQNELMHPPGAFTLGERLVDQPQGNVLFHVQPREQPVLLEHDAAFATNAADGAAIDADAAAVFGIQPHQQA
ncbi:hypothetical protein D3C81_1917090 [compost metagenome]